MRGIYDGWVPIAKWDDTTVRKAIREIDEALSIFSLNGSISFEWEPKYPISNMPDFSNCLEDKDLKEIEEASKLIDSLNLDGKVALYRSIAWLSQGIRLNEPVARFLFSILAIESLARYIEEDASDESPLAVLRSDTLTKAERRLRREKCIDKFLSCEFTTNQESHPKGWGMLRAALMFFGNSEIV